MMAYTLLYVYMAVLLILSHNIRTNLFFYLASLLLILFSGFRNDVGMDYASYNQTFNDINVNSQSLDFEFLNMLIIKSFQYVGLSNQAIFLFYSLLILSGVSYFIKKLSPSKEFSLLIFLTIGIFYLSTFNGIRQWAALSMFLIAIVKLIDKKYLQMIAFLLAGFYFHTSMLVTFFIIPLLSKRFSIKIVLLSLIFLIGSSKVILFLILNSQYNIYLAQVSQNGSSGFLFQIYIVLLVCILIYFNYFKPKIILGKAEIVLLNMNIASIATLLVGHYLELSFLSIMRVNMYFQIQLIILIPILIHRIREHKLKQFVVIVTVLLCSGYFFYLLSFNGEIYHLLPYKFNFELI